LRATATRFSPTRPSLAISLMTGLLIGLVIIFVVDAWPAIIRFGISFVSSTMWDPVQEMFGTLPLQIYKYALSPYKDWQQQAWAGAFILIILVLGISVNCPSTDLDGC
jgi:phosphate transport system permease protein